MQNCDQKEEGAVGGVDSLDTDSHSQLKSQDSAQSSKSDADLSSSPQGSQVKAAKMSEVGIFERFSHGCEHASDDTEPPVSEAEGAVDKRQRLGSPRDTEAGCSAENKESAAKSPTSQDSLQHNSGAGQDSSSKSPSVQPADSTLLVVQVPDSTAISLATKTSTGSVHDDVLGKSPSVSPSIRSPSSVSRNLFETFLAISQSEETSQDEREDEPLPAESSGDVGNVQPINACDSGGGDFRDGNMQQSASVESSTVETAVDRVAQSTGGGPTESADSSHASSSGSVAKGATVDGVASGDNAPEDDAPAVSSSGDDIIEVKADDKDSAVLVNSISTQSNGSLRSAAADGSPEGSAAVQRESASESVARSDDRHVTINVATEEADSRALVPRYERPFPRDFNTIRMKLEADKYTSVVSYNFVVWTR